MRRGKRNAKSDLHVGWRKKSKMDLVGQAEVGKVIIVQTGCEKVYHLSFVSERRELLIVNNETAIIQFCNVDSISSRVSRSGLICPIAPKFSLFFDFGKPVHIRPHIVRATSDGSVVWFVCGNLIGCIENGVIACQTVHREFGFVDGGLEVAQFCGIDDLAISSDGRFAFASDRGNSRIRCMDRQSKRVFTVAGDGTRCNETDGPAELATIDRPDALCVDPYSVIPNSVLYFGTTTRIARLRLSETATDVLNYYLVNWCGDPVWYSLIRDLWFVIAEYMAENASVNTVMKSDFLTWSIALLPSRHLLIGTNSRIRVINPKDGEQELIINVESLNVNGIRSIAIDQLSKCAYISNHYNSSLLLVNLPLKYFSIPD